MGLKRELGLFQVTMAGVGYILGAGIYVLIGVAAGQAGNSIWLSFLIAAVVALFTGLSYAEMSSMIPDDAGEYLYARRAFNKFFGFFVFIMMIFSSIIGTSSVAIGFGGYLSVMFNINNILLLAIAGILLFSFINYKSMKDSSFLNVICTFAEVSGLLLIIVLALWKGHAVDYSQTANGLSSVFKGAALIFFAYIGFQAVIKLAEETKNPRKTIPKALMLSLIISTILYIAVGLAAVSVLDWSSLAASKAPLAEVAKAIMGNKAFFLLGIIAILSTANTVLMGLVTVSRSIYGFAEKFKRFKTFAKIDRRGMPYKAIFITSILTIIFLFFGDIGFLAELTNFAIFVTFIMVNLSLIVLRYKEPDAKRPFKVGLNIGRFPVLPFLGVLSSFFMIFNLELIVIIGGMVFSVLIVLLYLLLEHRKI